MLAISEEESVDDMSKRTCNDQIVTAYVTRFNEVGRSRPEFDHLLAQMRSDKQVGALEAVAIARRYGFRVAKTKKAALEAIEKKFGDLVRTSALIEIAKKVRVL